MRTREARAGALLAAFLPAVLGAHCATDPTPVKFRRTSDEALVSGLGAYARVEVEGGGVVTGELVAATGGALTLLTDTHRLGIVAFERVHALTLGVHEVYDAAVVGWALLGTLSTLSHGAFLILTAPIWIFSGIGAGVGESYRGLYMCPARGGALTFRECLEHAGVFARFPQGLPPGVGEAQVLGRAPVRVAPVVVPKPADAGGEEGGVDAGADAAPGDFPAPYQPKM